VLHRLEGGEAMLDIVTQFVNEFYVFALTVLGMVLAYFGKIKDKQDKENK
jgi:hypothetical protein